MTRQPGKKPGVRPRLESLSASTEAPQASVRAPLGLFSLPPLSLYVHVPWCVRKCPYCDFNSHELRGELPENDYLNALQADLELALPQIWGRQIVSVFIGGGTPSLLSAAAMDRMLSMLRAYLNLWPETEITLEANPGTVEAARFRSYADSGITRLSLGVQSFDDGALQALGRIHDGDQARAAIDTAQACFERVNLDIMFALPDQTLESCEQDVRTAISFGTGHLSLYHLTLEPNTVFAKYPPAVPDDETSAIMQEHIVGLAEAAGFERYEVSAYARDGQRAVHNVNYWEFGDYLGIGPGAHSKLSFPDRVIRQARLRNPTSWMAAAQRRDHSHLADDHPIEPADFAFEFMLNALRLRDGVPASFFFERTGQPYASIAPILHELRAKGLLENDPMQIRTTELGWRFLNDVQGAFLT